MSGERWESYSPPQAPHVKGAYTARVWEPGEARPEPQMVKATCERCGAVYGPTECTSGRVRHKIDTFALVHLHRDVMVARLVVKLPGAR